MDAIRDKLARGRKAPVPVWFMRQAGRYLPEYRAIRARNSFLEVCKGAELAVEVTLQPLRRYPELSGAILFSDILVIPEAMGMSLDFPTGIGPVLKLKEGESLSDLKTVEPEKSLSFVGEILKKLRVQVPPHITLLGFSGTPFTLLYYILNSQLERSPLEFKKFILQNRPLVHEILQKLTDSVLAYLLYQAKNGAEILQLFDTWGGLLTKEHFKEFSYPYLVKIAEALKENSIPVIYYIKNSRHLFFELIKLPIEVLSLDYTYNPEWIVQNLPEGMGFQGNLDPTLLFAEKEVLSCEVRGLLKILSKIPKFIFNLGHGLIPGTPPESLSIVLAEIQKFNSKRGSAPLSFGGVPQ